MVTLARRVVPAALGVVLTGCEKVPVVELHDTRLEARDGELGSTGEPNPPEEPTDELGPELQNPEIVDDVASPAVRTAEGVSAKRAVQEAQLLSQVAAATIRFEFTPESLTWVEIDREGPTFEPTELDVAQGLASDPAAAPQWIIGRVARSGASGCLPDSSGEQPDDTIDISVVFSSELATLMPGATNASGTALSYLVLGTLDERGVVRAHRFTTWSGDGLEFERGKYIHPIARDVLFEGCAE